MQYYERINRYPLEFSKSESRGENDNIMVVVRLWTFSNNNHCFLCLPAAKGTRRVRQ